MLREMAEKQPEPHLCSVISYSAVISICEKGDPWEKALGLLWDMAENQLEPHVISYSAAIRACEKGD